MTPETLKILYYVVPIATGAAALVYALFRSSWVNKQDPGNDRMKEIAKWVREGAMAFLSREYRILAIFVVAVTIILAISNPGWVKLQAISFICEFHASRLIF